MRKDIKIAENAYLTNMTYKDYVEFLIRKRYKESDEFALLRQKDRKSEEYAEYDAYCEQCKAQAKTLFNT